MGFACLEIAEWGYLEALFTVRFSNFWIITHEFHLRYVNKILMQTNFLTIMLTFLSVVLNTYKIVYSVCTNKNS